jgi:hypothetical protein
LKIQGFFYLNSNLTKEDLKKRNQYYIIKNAEVLNAVVINDNLKASASFYYQLLTMELSSLVDGNLNMEGQAYVDYGTNDYAWDWVAAQLNLTITGDYVPPMPTPDPTPTPDPVPDPTPDPEPISDPNNP